MQLFLVAQNNTRKARTVSSLPPGASFISVRGSPWIFRARQSLVRNLGPLS